METIIEPEKVFPDCFPPEFVTEILPPDLPSTELSVYRICTNGKLNREAFLSTYEERFRRRNGKKSVGSQKELKDPGFYSTSCFYDIQDILKIFEQMQKVATRENPIFVYGKASSVYGPIQITRERTGKPNSHVDWWLYRDSDPSNAFGEVDVNGRKE